MKQKSDYQKAFIATLIAAFFSGGNAVFVKIGLRQIPPFSFIFIRFALASLVILPFFLKERPKITKDFYKVALFSLLPTISLFLFVFGLLHTTAIFTTLIGTLIPILSVVLSYFILGEKITSRTAFGIFIGFAGAFLVIFLPVWGKTSLNLDILFGNFIILVTDIFFAVYTVLSKNFHKKYSPIYLNTVFIISTAVIALSLCLFNFQANFTIFQSLTLESTYSILYLGFGVVLVYFLYQYAIKQGTPTIASMLLYLQLISTVGFASILLHEKLTSGMVVGACLILTGAFIVSRKQKINIEVLPD